MTIVIKNVEIPENGYMDVRIFADGECTTACKEHPYYRELETEVQD